MVPIRGSISASGDLSPLSYIAGTLSRCFINGRNTHFYDNLVANPSIRVFDGPATFGCRKMVSSRDALAAHNISPITLASKEPLGILNGTAFSASVASLALNDAVHLSLLAQVCTAMGTEALLGTTGNYDQFIHAVARPHPGQVSLDPFFKYPYPYVQPGRMCRKHLEYPQGQPTCSDARRGGFSRGRQIFFAPRPIPPAHFSSVPRASNRRHPVGFNSCYTGVQFQYVFSDWLQTSS